jgi:twinkle protein
MSLRDLHLVSREPVGPGPLYIDPDAALSIDALTGDILDLYETGLQPGVTPEWLALRPYYTMKPGQVTVVTGIPHSGKTPVVNALAMHCLVAHDWAVAWSSPEHLPYHDLAARLLQQFYKVLSFSEGTVMKMSRVDVLRACVQLAPKLFFLPASERDATISHVLDRCLPLLEHGLRGLVIDPYGEFEHRRPSGMTETEYVSQLLTEIRLFARKHAVHVWLIAHPTKIQKQDDGNYAIVKPYDIAGSAAWFNKPDNILSVYRTNDAPDLTQIHIQKVKFREVGHTGSCTLRHDARTGTFADIPPESDQR